MYLLQLLKIYNKISLFAIVISIIILDSCSSYIIPLEGNYVDTFAEITSTKPVDSTWSNITQLFVEKGLSIKKLEIEKGVIVSTKSSFIAYTFEDKDGKLIEPEARIVLKKVLINKKEWNHNKIFCKWNIQIAETGKGISTVRVSPIVICTYYPNMFTSIEDHAQSTGKLEELLERSLRNNYNDDIQVNFHLNQNSTLVNKRLVQNNYPGNQVCV